MRLARAILLLALGCARETPQDASMSADGGGGDRDAGITDASTADAMTDVRLEDSGAPDASGRDRDAEAADAEGVPDAAALDCSDQTVRCVGVGREYGSIQDAADSAEPGDEILVFEGSYAGFEVSTNGSSAAPIVFRAVGTVVIDRPASTGDGIRLQNVSYVHVDGFEIESPDERCIAARGATPEAPMRGLLIRNVRCRGAGVEGFYLSEVADSVIEGNEISGSGASGSTRSHGIYLANAGSDGTTIRGNSIFGAGPSESNGIHVNGDLSVGGDGVVSGLVVEANTIHHNAQNGLNFDGVQDALVFNNVIHDNARNALRAYAIDGAEGPASLTVVNNILSTPSNGGWAIKLTEDLGGHVVFNNILLATNRSTGAICVERPDRLQSAANAGTGRFSADDESTIVDAASWSTLGLNDGWVEASGSDVFEGADGFRTKPGAAVIDRGRAAFGGRAAPTIDIEGTRRPRGADFDLGAYEF